MQRRCDVNTTTEVAMHIAHPASDASDAPISLPRASIERHRLMMGRRGAGDHRASPRMAIDRRSTMQTFASGPTKALHAPRRIVTLPIRESEPAHERAVHHALARSLAWLLGGHYAGDHDPVRDEPGPADTRCYFLPSSTIVGADRARALGIIDGDDLFGGVVDEAFICTKAISHAVVGPDAHRPPGWSDAFSQRTTDAVLAGWTAFSADDAREGARRLLRHGPVRLKPVDATAGRGQQVLHDDRAIDEALQRLDPDALGRTGIVVEAHLEDVVTLSVGQVHVAGMTIAYTGTQRLVPDNQGEHVYGGSTLTVVRGGLDALLARPLPGDIRRAVTQAQCYDEAARACYPGLCASRRNYDIAQGRAADGRWHSGVLEQSWRVGGASAAELAAMLRFAQDPSLDAVEASTYEVYGATPMPTPARDAAILYHGDDPDLGRLMKYVTIKAHGDT